MEKASLLDKLDKATDRGARLAISKCMPLRISDKSTLVGNIFVEKLDNGSFNILSNKTVIYSNIFIFDIAVIIAQRYNVGEIHIIKKVLILEERFTKYWNDMEHYLHCLKGAKAKRDNIRMAILEDKFQLAEISARIIRAEISIFKK